MIVMTDNEGRNLRQSISEETSPDMRPDEILECLWWQRLVIVEAACRIPVVDLAKQAMSRLAPTQVVARTLFQVDQFHSRRDVPNLGIEEVTGDE